ncbi:MAG: hypothetical protein IT323_16925, partial [Anaerolineae bacterium]|nr:hypothetical protein [Anaerolineae bacterium]
AGAVFAPSRVIAEGRTGALEIPLRGQDVRTGPNTNASPQDIRGMVSAFELAWTSDNEPDILGGEQEDVLINHADLRYVGITSDYPAQLARAGGNVTTALERTTVYVGLATWGAWSTLREIAFNVYFDVDRNGTDDILLRNVQAGTSSTPPLDVFWAQVINLSASTSVYQAPVNEFYPSNAAAPFGFPVRNTYVLNNNVLALPVDALAPATSVSLGLSAANTSFNFRVETVSRDYGLVEVSPRLSYNIAAPALDFTGGFTALPWWADFDGAAVPMTYNLDNFSATSGRGLYALLLHHHNAGPLFRPQIVCVAAPGLPDCPVEEAAGAVGGAGSASMADPGGPTMLPLTGYAPRAADDGSVLAGSALGVGLLLMLAAVALVLVRRRKR